MMALLLLILSPLALAAASMSRRQDLPEGVTTLAVFEEITSSETSVGVIVQKCLVLVDDPSQRFCMVSVDQEVVEMGVEEGGAVSSGLSLAPNATATSSTIQSSEPTSIGEPILSPPSFSDSAAPQSTSTLLDAVSSAPTPSSDPTGFSASETNSTTALSDETTISTSSAFQGPSSESITSSEVTSSSSSVDPASSQGVSDESALQADPTAVSLSPTSNVLPSPTSNQSFQGFSVAESSSVPAPTPSGSSSTSTDSVLTITRPLPSASILNTPTASSITSADLAAAAADTTSTPGQSIQVLPIGLGVFGGLVVITLSIVGYVLYERRRYKRLFRSRKVAEGKSHASA